MWFNQTKENMKLKVCEKFQSETNQIIPAVPALYVVNGDNMNVTQSQVYSGKKQQWNMFKGPFNYYVTLPGGGSRPSVTLCDRGRGGFGRELRNA